MKILDVALHLQLFGTILAICLNFILIQIVAFTKNSSIGRFKYMIIGFAVYESAFAIVVLAFMPISFVGERTWLIFTAAGPLFGTRFAFLGPALYCYFHYNWVLFVMIHFLYRYVLLCRPALSAKITKSFLRKVAIGICWALASGYLANCAFNFCTSIEVSEAARDKVKAVYGPDIDFEDGYALLRLTNITTHQLIWALIGTGNHYLFYPGTMSIIMFCCVKCYARIRKLDLLVSREAQIHKEVFTTLVIQTTIPVFLCHAPGIIYLSFPFIEEGSSMGVFSVLFTLLGTVPKVLDPIFTLTFIHPYRRAVLRRLRCFGAMSAISPYSSTGTGN